MRRDNLTSQSVEATRTFETPDSRRRFLSLLLGGAVAGVSGCLTGEETKPGRTTSDPIPKKLRGPVAKPYKTARSLGGTKRDPHRVSEKATVNYQGSPQNGESCANCAAYIPDKNDDGLGACVLVAGYFEPDDWCAVWTELPSESDDETATTTDA